MHGIMIAIDLSPFTDTLMARGMELARKLAVPVTLLHVVEIPVNIGVPEAGPVFINDTDITVNQVREKLEGYKATYPDVGFDILVFAGDPKTDTLDAAMEKGADLLVVGTHGRTGLDHMLVGSTAEYIIRHARIPVLVVPYNTQEH